MNMNESFSSTGFIPLDFIEEGRKNIIEWRDKRRNKRSGIQGRIHEIATLFIDKSLIQSFISNLSIVVAFQMFLAAICTYACVKLELEFDVHMSLFVSPIVFPLAFSINANYQRRETVLEDLAMFKAASMILFFCHRDWIKAIVKVTGYDINAAMQISFLLFLASFDVISGLPAGLLQTLSNKLASLVIGIKEYLYTDDSNKRKVILQAVYEDFSDISQLNDKIRMSELKSNSSLIARVIHCHTLMCWSFEKLRVIKEYKSPRSLRSFTKVFIFFMPLLLSPYYVFTNRRTNSVWAPYIIATLVSFLFGSLQAVQDKLDDPFDGIGEDDVHLGQLDEWTRQSLLTHRTMTLGRFTVTTTAVVKEKNNGNISPLQIRINQREEVLSLAGSPKRLRRSLKRKQERDGRRSTAVGLDDKEFTDQLESRCHGIASKLEGLSGSTTIGRRTTPSTSELISLSDVASGFPSTMWTEEPKSGNESSDLGFSDSGSDKEDGISTFPPRKTGLDVVLESDEDHVDSSRPYTSHAPSTAVNSLMGLFASPPNELQTDKSWENDSSAKTNGVPVMADKTEQSPLLEKPPSTPSESTASLLSPPVSSDLDSSQENIGSTAEERTELRHPEPLMFTFPISRETEQDTNKIPRLKFSSVDGKRKAWSMPDSLNKWRKRRSKKNASSLEAIDQLGSESGLTVASSESPLLLRDIAGSQEEKGDSERKSSVESNKGLESTEENQSWDSKKPTSKLANPNRSLSRFSVLRRSSEILSQCVQGSGKSTNSAKTNGSRFNGSPS